MIRSKPFHQFLQETCSLYGFLAEPNLNESFSNTMTCGSLLTEMSRDHHQFAIELERQAVSQRHINRALPAALRPWRAGLTWRAAPIFSQLAQQ
jgi:hypothetical protein